MRTGVWSILVLVVWPVVMASGARAEVVRPALDVANNGPQLVRASPPTAVSITLYRDPSRSVGSIRLSALGGFALVTETREVHLPVGESRLRFEGVVDGIQTSTAIVTGLPYGVIERNRDAQRLSPEALVRASLDGEVTLVRGRPRARTTQSLAATIRSADATGVVLQTDEGVEALRCSGLSETLQFGRIPEGLSSVPSFWVLTRSARAVTATVTLSYLASGFDWSANYVAHLSPGGRMLDLGAWVTLANANSVSLTNAAVQVVAGRLNHKRPAVETTSAARMIARCWPTGATSDRPEEDVQVFAVPHVKGPMPLMAEMRALASAAPPPRAEVLGDLKLYRLSRPITIAAHQSKQIRLLDQSQVAYTRVFSAELPIRGETSSQPAAVLLRSRNTSVEHLGLPLPAGEVAIFRIDPRGELLVGDAPLADTAVGEAIELKLGRAPGVLVSQMRLPGETAETVRISNGGSQPADFELRLSRSGTARVSHADQPMSMKDGRPLFRLAVPANGSALVHYDVTSHRG